MYDNLGVTKISDRIENVNLTFFISDRAKLTLKLKTDTTIHGKTRFMKKNDN